MYPKIDAAGRPGAPFSRRDMLAALGVSASAWVSGLMPQAGRAQALARRAAPACVLRPEQTEGPFFVDEHLNRSDIRSDPGTGEVKPGVALRVGFNVSRLSAQNCAALPGAQVDLWHADADGRYSDAGGLGHFTAGQRFLRGYQLTDASGGAQFLTIFPGWYGGRAVHLHFKIRWAAAPGYAFTSQLYFDDALSARVFANEPYASRGRRWMRNDDDAIFRDGGGAQLLLPAEPDGAGYAASIAVGLQV